MAGGHLVAAGDVAHDAGAVDGEGEGAADAGVVERRDVDVETVDVGGEKQLGVEKLGVIAIVDGDFGNRNGVGHVQLAGAEGALLGVLALDGVEENFVQSHGGGIPIGRALHAADVLVGLPLGEGERAVADEVAGAGPRGAALVDAAKLLDRRAVQGIPRSVADHRRQVGHRVVEGEDEREVVGRAGADEFGVGDRAGVESRAVFERVEHGGVFGAEAGREHAPEGENEIAGGDRIAVRPAAVAAQVEGPGKIVRRHFPTLGGGGDRCGSLGVVLGEAFHEGHDDRDGVGAVGDLRIEVVRLAEIADVNRLGAVAGLDAGLAFGAGAQGESEGNNDEPREKFHGDRYNKQHCATHREVRSP